MRQDLRLLLGLALLSPSLCLAHGLPHNEVQVNAWTTGHQQRPRVALSPHGDVFVVWESEERDASVIGVAGTYFDHFGQTLQPEFVVNTYTTGAQLGPDIAKGVTGGFLVTWPSFPFDGDSVGIAAQLIDEAGQPTGSDLVVNSWTTGIQANPSVAGLQGGGFVVVWEDESGADGHGFGIRGRLVDAAGSPFGGDFQVNSFTTGDQIRPSVAGDVLGGFVVAWSGDVAGDPDGISARRFDDAGSPLGGEFAINTYTTGTQSRPQVGTDAAGGFAVVWAGPGEGDPYGGVFVRRFDPAGGPLGLERRVNATTAALPAEPALAMGAGGEFVIVWHGSTQADPDLGIVAQVFDPSGLRMRGNFQVNTWTTAGQGFPAVALDPNGFVVAWMSGGQDGSGYGIFHRPYPPPGTCLTGDDDGDEVCQDNDNCPATLNTGQENTLSDLTGDACDVSITAPVPAALLDCADPRASRPTIEWDPGDYDRFKVFLSSSSLFSKRLRVSSGDWKAITSWTPGAKRWRAACALATAADPANPVLFVRVQGKDGDLGAKHFLKTTFSAAVAVSVTP